MRRFPGYGKLSGKNLDELQAGARVEVDERKRDPLDFALWKAAKPGEPAWESPWGPGRPGWHIECSAMAMQYLGETFDIHGGGEDLIFPHHENEIAQSEAATGKPFARYWLHNGFVNLGGEKMSKSLGNTLTIKDLVRRHDPEALRLYLLGTHYRSPLEFGDERITEAGRALERLRALKEEAERIAARGTPAPGPDGGLFDQVAAQRARFEAAMDDDFNTPQALGVLFDLARRAPHRPRAGGAGRGGRGRLPHGGGRAGHAEPGAGAARGRQPPGHRHRSPAQGQDRVARLPAAGGAPAAGLRRGRPASRGAGPAGGGPGGHAGRDELEAPVMSREALRRPPSGNAPPGAVAAEPFPAEPTADGPAAGTAATAGARAAGTSAS